MNGLGGRQRAFPGDRRPVVFCDFDGTITEHDNIVAVMRHFRPDGWETVARDIMEGRRSVRDGVGRMFALLPSDRKDDIVRFAVANARIRGGFGRLLRFCRERGVEFLVTSGGLDFFVLPLLAPFGVERDRIFCNVADFSGPVVRVLWPHPCDESCRLDCGMCKPSVMRRYPGDRYFRILIGDGVTDFAAAELADLVFARSSLADRCRKLGRPFVPFETFDDVVAELVRTTGRFS